MYNKIRWICVVIKKKNKLKLVVDIICLYLIQYNMLCFSKKC